MVFVNSMSDLFHRDVPDNFVRDIFEVMLSADRHVYQVLTKRPARAVRFWGKFAARLGHATDSSPYLDRDFCRKSGSCIPSPPARRGTRRGALSFVRAPARPFGAGPAPHSVGDRGRGKRRRLQADGARVGALDSRSVSGGRGPILLQAVGWPHSKGGRQPVGPASVASVS